MKLLSTLEISKISGGMSTRICGCLFKDSTKITDDISNFSPSHCAVGCCSMLMPNNDTVWIFSIVTSDDNVISYKGGCNPNTL